MTIKTMYVCDKCGEISENRGDVIYSSEMNKHFCNSCYETYKTDIDSYENSIRNFMINVEV